METRANYIAIGLFMISVIACGFFFIYWLARTTDGPVTRDIVVVFPSPVNGLVKGSQVLFNGIRVGEVTTLELVDDHPEQVKALVSVDATKPFKKDTRVEVGYQGLTGVAFVQFIGGTLDAGTLFDVERPEVVASQSDFQNLIEGAKSVLKTANAALTDIRDLVKKNGPSVDNTIANVQQFSQSLADNAEGVDTFLSDVSEAAKSFNDLSKRAQALAERADKLLAAVDTDAVKGTVEDVRTFAGSLADAAKSVDGVIADAKKAAGDISKFAENLNGSLEAVNKIIAGVDSEQIARVVDNVDDVTGRFAARGEDLEAFIKSARETADNLKSISGSIAERTEDVQKIITDVQKAAESVNATLAAAQDVIGAVKPESVSKTVANVEDVTTRIAGKGDEIETFIDNAGSAADNINKVSETVAARGKEIDKIITDADAAAGNINAVSETLAARSEDIQAIIADVRSASKTLDETLARADKVIAAIEPEAVSRTVANVDDVAGRIAGKGEAIESVIDNANSASGNIDKISEAIAARSDEIQGIIDDVRSAATKMEETLSGADKLIASIDTEQVASTVKNVEGLTKRLADRGDDFDAIVTDTRAAMGDVRAVTGDIEKRRKDINQVITDTQELAGRLNAASVRVERILGRVDDLIGDGTDAAGLITEATAAARSIRKVAVSFEKRSETIAGGLARFSGRGLREVEAMVMQWRRAAQQLERAIQKVERNPQQFLFGNGGVRAYNPRR